MLRNLSDADKKDTVELLGAIEKTFSLYWRHYPPYHTLQDRSSTLDTLLHDKTNDNRSGRLRWSFFCMTEQWKLDYSRLRSHPVTLHELKEPPAFRVYFWTVQRMSKVCDIQNTVLTPGEYLNISMFHGTPFYIYWSMCIFLLRRHLIIPLQRITQISVLCNCPGKKCVWGVDPKLPVALPQRVLIII